MRYSLASIIDESGATAAVVVDGHAAPLSGRPPMSSVIADWDVWRANVEGQLADGAVRRARPLASYEVLPPLPNPPNLFMLGANYGDHSREMGDVVAGAPVPKPPEGPFVFLKPTGTLIADGAAIEIPPGVERLDWEVELAVVIGRPARHVPAEQALEYVFGYTVLNDVSARDRFHRPSSPPPMAFDWFQQKGWATTCPCGPLLVPGSQIPDPGDLRLTLTVNGELHQDGNTADMIFDVREQIAFLSSVVPLQPGDIIATGTPAGVGQGKGSFLRSGDHVAAEIEHVGRLENRVTAADSMPAADGRDDGNVRGRK